MHSSGHIMERDPPGGCGTETVGGVLPPGSIDVISPPSVRRLRRHFRRLHGPTNLRNRTPFLPDVDLLRLRLGCHKSSRAAPRSVGMPRPVRESLINGGYQQVGNPSVCCNAEQGDGALPVSQKSLLESNGRRAFLRTNWGFTQCRRSISEKMQARAEIGSGPGATRYLSGAIGMSAIDGVPIMMEWLWKCDSPPSPGFGNALVHRTSNCDRYEASPEALGRTSLTA